jgi:hypothetical protein
VSTSADDVLYLDLSESSVDAANNRSLVHWRVRFYCGYGVNATQSGNAYVNGALVWNYSGNPGYFTYGNTYTVAEGDIWIGHDAAGNGTASGTAHLQTTTAGQAWSFSKDAASSVGLTGINRVPSAPGTPSPSGASSSALTFSWGGSSANGGNGITSYRLQVATDAGFGSLVYNGDVAATALQVTGLSPNTTYDARVYANSATGVPSAWSGTGAGATAPVAPPAPSAAALTRNSDTSFTVVWTNNPSGPGPYANVVVQRQADAGSWVTVATLAGSATSYTDTTTAADHSYAYRVYATNSAGSSASSTTSTLVTTPAAPSAVTAARGTGASVDLSWVNNATPGYQTVVEGSNGSGGWTAKATLAAGVTAWTDASPLAGTTQYRLHAVTTGSPTLSSAYATSNTVVTIIAPNAPTGLTAGPVVDAAEAIAFGWVHSPIDGSAQRKYQVQYRLVGAGAWTTPAAVTTGVSSWTMPAGTLSNGHSYEWQVRTWGAATTGGSDGAGGSPWSATASFATSARPTAAISAPSNAGTVTASSVATTWAYYDAEGTTQAAWRARLLDATGTVLETVSGAGAATTAAFTPRIVDGASYQITVEVQDGSGLWSTGAGIGHVTFAVAYARPPVPVLLTSWDPDAATVSVQIQNPAPGAGEVAANHVDLYRSIGGGPLELIATGVPLNTTVTDYTPTVAGTNTYRAIAVSALPSTSTSLDTAQVTSSDSVWLSGGRGFSQVCRARYSVALANTGGLTDKVLQQFAGRTEPVEFAGTATSRVLTLQALIPPDLEPGEASSDEEWLALAELPGPHLWRDPAGRRVVVSVSQVDVPRAVGGIVTLGLKATRIARA